ncbi:putative enoyl-CoA hydratase echA8 [Mycolicibacterium vanbaalenii]|uniref:Putative enoyl-CoA hydratase echA8 n=1 Tax=Mycolicibacterium vanbaalenii TaxID=110539 RepID=A0A5S9NG67_MYCVN|nr:enoyl-CoA hydratase-related protein [Mycolicibacterium vanbaalenii]CAA0089398.1 putative enoyl-CoA hydratase echA8 [Mycolicibacterium vanbaalenii]
MAGGPVLLDLEDNGVATIRLNRPEAANAMDVPLLSALHAALLRCHAEPGVRVVVLTGSGNNFCSGGDVGDFLAHADRLPSHIKEVSSWFQTVSSMLIGLDVPVVAAVQGYAAGGGGLGLVGSCDFVIAGESARFMSGAVRVGMIPDGGLTTVLTQLVGLRKAFELTLTNVTIDADEALRIGLITRVVPDDALMDEALALARSLLAMAPMALAECKHLLWNGIGSTIAHALTEEARAVIRLAGTRDCIEGLHAVADRRRPAFGGR